MGIGTERKIISDDIEFANLAHCLVYADLIVKRYGYETPRDRALAYCIPKRILPSA